MRHLKFTQGLANEIVAACRREFPREACGLLAGRADTVLAVLPMPNAAEDPRRNYLVEAGAQRQAFELMAEKGWELLGIYHSHPSDRPVPSPVDIAQARYPGVVHVIVGLGTKRPEIRGYRLIPETGRCVRVRLDLVNQIAARRSLSMGRRHPRRSVACAPFGGMIHLTGAVGHTVASLPTAGGLSWVHHNDWKLS